MPSFVPYYAVVMVDPDTDGTDPTRGETLFTKRTRLEAKTLKEGILKGLEIAGFDVSDPEAVKSPTWIPAEAKMRLLVCPMVDAPKMAGQ